MRIGIDIDGVLFPFSDVADAVVSKKFGTPSAGPWLTWDHFKDHVPPECWAWLWSAEGQDSVFSRVGEVYPGVVEAFNAVIRDPEHRCHFVTHRDPRRTTGHTAAFLARHFGAHPWAGVHVLQNNIKKHNLAKWDVFIDDKPETVYDMLDHTNAQVFAPARPWNEELDGLGTDRLIRYSNPLEVSRWVALQ